MKRWICGALAATSLFLGGRGSDIAKLEAVKTLEVSVRNGQVRLWTDTGSLGIGRTLPDAFENLKETASGEVFLETAEYLLLTPDCKALLDDLWSYLRPSCVVCLLDGEGDLDEVGTYLDAHQPQNTLMDYRAGERKLPTLQIRGERMIIVF